MKTAPVYVGIDVSAKKLDVAISIKNQVSIEEFENTPKGHQQIVDLIALNGADVRICMEATGFYSLDLALALDTAKLPCMVVNPRSARNFLKATMQRAKTDVIDAKGLALYAEKMAFRKWNPPSTNRRHLCLIGRRREDLVCQITAEKNRRHAMEATETSPELVLTDIEEHLKFLEKRLFVLETKMLAMLEGDEELRQIYEAISSVKGIKEKAGMVLLSELLMLPMDMSGKEVVAHAGLDPKTSRSGTSVHGSRSISRNGNVRLRSTLYMVALVATQHEEAVRAKYLDLVERRGKPKKLALVAIMRKMLLAVWSQIKKPCGWDGAKFATVANHMG